MQKNRNSQQQIQTIKQKLSLQNIQLFKMMELDVLQFEQKVKEELDVNPALENNDTLEYSNGEYKDSDFASGSYNDSVLDTSVGYTYEFKSPNNYEYNSNDEEREIIIPIKDNESLVSDLLNQLRYVNLSDKQFIIGEFIIGNLDDYGYLRRTITSIVDDLSFRQNLYTDEEEVQEVLNYIQQLDPPGIGAANLQECMLLQLRKIKSTVEVKNAIEIVENFFQDLYKKNFKKIQSKLNLSDVELKKAYGVITNLSPKPTEKNLNEDTYGKYIIPDFLIVREGEVLKLELHTHNSPNLAVSPYFLEMLQKIKKDRKELRSEEASSKDYLMNNINKAQMFITLIKERQETMILVMNAIMEVQYDYLLTGDEYDLKPMTLKTIADITGFDVSTISRITSSKYVQTEYGILSLKSFFGESYLNNQGEIVSTKVIMKALQEFVESEDKSNPLSDEELTDKLRKIGFNIARRTTAKYREKLNIGPKFIRKQTLNI